MKEYFFADKKIFYKKNDFLKGRPTLVFVHGLSGSSAAWIKYENYFENKYNILTFDLRGHGKSYKPRHFEDYTFVAMAEDMHALLKFENISNFILVSHSYGVLVALEYLSQYQNNTIGSIFLSPNYNVNKRWLAKIIKPFLHLTKLTNLLPFSERSRGHVDYNKYQNTGDWNLRRMIADIGITSPRVYFFCTRQSYNLNKEKFLSEINIPTLIIHGKQDTIFPYSNAVEMSQKIKKSELIILNNTDHIIVLNNFSEVSVAIEKFIDKLF